jgi:hypothetical protein
MQRRFSQGISPLKCKEQKQNVASALRSTFRRVNLSLASCTSAELAYVSVQNKIHTFKLQLQLVEKGSHVQHGVV